MPKNILLSVEFNTRLKQDRQNWQAMFHTFDNLFLSRPNKNQYHINWA